MIRNSALPARTSTSTPKILRAGDFYPASPQYPQFETPMPPNPSPYFPGPGSYPEPTLVEPPSPYLPPVER
jgi:hypothetical protein